MNPVRRLAGVYVTFAALLFPLFVLRWVEGIDANTASGYGTFAYLGVALIYSGIAVTGRPKVFYLGSSRIGVNRKILRVLCVSAALFMIGVPVGELGRTGYVVAMLALLSAVGLFLWAMAAAALSSDQR